MSVSGYFWGVELYHGKIIKMQRTLEAVALRVFLRTKVAAFYANEAQAPMQASRLSEFDRRSILPASCYASRQRTEQRVWTRLQPSLAKGEEAILGKPPSLRRVWTGRKTNFGNRGRSYQATPGRSGVVLGREELATALQKVSRSKDTIGRSASWISLLTFTRKWPLTRGGGGGQISTGSWAKTAAPLRAKFRGIKQGGYPENPGIPAKIYKI